MAKTPNTTAPETDSSDGTSELQTAKTSGLSRRALLGFAAVGGLGAGLVGAPAAAGAATTARLAAGALPAAALAAGAPPAGPVTAAAATLTPFPQQADINFQIQMAYGEVAYAAGEPGEIGITVGQVQAAMPTSADDLPVYQPYLGPFEKLAATTAASADAELAAGRTATARDRYLRAASYYNCVLYFVPAGDQPGREAEIYGAMQRCWAAAAALLAPAFERVEVPAIVRFPGADGTVTTRTVTLPAYWARASGTGVKPTVIVNNGSDAQFIDTYVFGGAAGVERGYNVLLFEGPGQGALLFEQNIPFTPYWQDVITPLVDFVIAQPEVDAARIALTGWSFGGVLVMRAAAHEHRIAAVVADPAFHDNLSPWSGLIDALQQNFGGVSNEAWQELYSYSPPSGALGQLALRALVNKRGEIYSSAAHDEVVRGEIISDIVGLFAAVSSFSGDAALFGSVTAHVMLNEYEGDQFVTDASKQSAQIAAWLTSAASVTQNEFTAAQGAQFHCSPLGARVRNEVVYEWLDTVMAVGPTPQPTPTPTPVVPPAPPVPPAADGGNALAATGANSAAVAPVAAIATGLATAGAGAVALAAKVSRRSRA